MQSDNVERDTGATGAGVLFHHELDREFRGEHEGLTLPGLAGADWNGITVEVVIDSTRPMAEGVQTLISQWRPGERFDAFDAYDAGSSSGLDTTGFLGAVFDGRYIYFSPQHDLTGRHGKALRYDTHGAFDASESWAGYDASATDGLVTKGYYGAVFDGRYVYYIPRTDGDNYHTRVLRVDTRKPFDAPASWQAFDLGVPISYQSGAFDGRYLYLAPGFGKEVGQSGLVWRYDSQQPFDDTSSWQSYDANNTGGLPTKNFDGMVFDGRYMYYVPLSCGAVLRYDTQATFDNEASWAAFDAKPLGMARCVGGVYDGRHVYFAAYDHNVIVRYDTRGPFEAAASWGQYDVKQTQGLTLVGYDGGFFDGRFVYFVPFYETDADKKPQCHGQMLRYDTTGPFETPASWQVHDAGSAPGLPVPGVPTIGYNAGTFDGRYFYAAPWHDCTESNRSGKIVGHGRVLRFDTLGDRGTFSLRYVDYGHNGGLCGAVPGTRFLVNTDQGVRSIAANRVPAPGRHYIVGVYGSERISLYIDGKLVNEQPASGKLINSDVPVSVGKVLDGQGHFQGTVDWVRISGCARDAAWVQAQHGQIVRQR